MSKTNRYPLLRIRIYLDRRSAVEGYKRHKEYLDGQSLFVFKDSELTMEDRYLRVEYWNCVDLETKIRGVNPDRIDIVNWIPIKEDLLFFQQQINPRTTVINPIRITNE